MSGARERPEKQAGEEGRQREDVREILRRALLGVYSRLYENPGQAELAAESATERIMARLPEGEVDPEVVGEVWEEELEALAERMPSERSVGELAAVLLHHLRRG